jgi:hypothetical protein
MGVHDPKAEKAARKAYGIPEDEPIFVLRAQDKLSTRIVARYRNDAATADLPLEFMADLDETVNSFANWQTDNADKVKLPD